MQNPFEHAPDPCDQLPLYRKLVNLDAPFTPPVTSSEDHKELLRTAIRALWDKSAERELDIYLPVFLKYFAKDAASLIQLLHLVSQACSPISLTEAALELSDLAYTSTAGTKHTLSDTVSPQETLRSQTNGYLFVYDTHEEIISDATICICNDEFALLPGNYRSFRINALAGPRTRRDCALINERLTAKPWAIATRGYFSSSHFIIHCRYPYLDSELSTRQRFHLREAYIDSLALAFVVGARSVSLPLIAPSGSKETLRKAYRTATEAIFSARKMGWAFHTVHLTGVAEGKEPGLSGGPSLTLRGSLSAFGQSDRSLVRRG